MHRDTQPPQVLMVNIFLLSHIKNFSYCVEVFVFKLTKDKEFDKCMYMYIILILVLRQKKKQMMFLAQVILKYFL